MTGLTEEQKAYRAKNVARALKYYRRKMEEDPEYAAKRREYARKRYRKLAGVKKAQV